MTCDGSRWEPRPSSATILVSVARLPPGSCRVRTSSQSACSSRSPSFLPDYQLLLASSLRPVFARPSLLPFSALLSSLADPSCTLPTINGLHHMVAPASTPTQQPQASAQHQYGTRIRSNSGIKPSIRLRHSASSVAPTPRRIKPAPTAKAKHPSVTPDAPLPEYPHFPPDHVMLHHDDANSKVFMAIGRSFMSVVSVSHMYADHRAV